MTETPITGSNPAPLKLNESAFRDIRPEELPQYIKEIKTVVMEGLRERLQDEKDNSERESLAFSIGALSEIERIVQHWRAAKTNLR
jgi:hypothetical protein